MSPYSYRCEQCDAASRPVATRAAAEAQRARHQRISHGGLTPRGDRIEHVHGHAARDPNSRYLSTRAVLAGLGLLALASLISRVLGR